MKTARTRILDIAYAENGLADGRPVVLIHGFPDDIHAYDGVAPPLASAGYRVIVPYLRGYGPTRFLDPATPRSGQQAALGHDLLDLINALGLKKPILAGYDWGGRAACIVAALWARSARRTRLDWWLQHPKHRSLGAPGAASIGIPSLVPMVFLHRARSCWARRKSWTAVPPSMGVMVARFTDADNGLTAASFDNPDFADVVIQSYRHRYGNAPGDSAYDATEMKLAAQSSITVPTIVLHGEADGVGPPAGSEAAAPHFTNSYERRVIPVAGHFLPRETPDAVVAAVKELGGL